MTPHQRQQLVTYLQQNGIVYQEVFDELYDHLLCSIEAQMEQGVSFATAFDQTTAALGGPQHVQQIQADRKKSIKKQYQRWVWGQFRLGLRNPLVVSVVALLGYLLWQILATAPGPGRIQFVLGTFTSLFVATWSYMLWLAGRQYWHYWRDRAKTPHSLVLKLINVENLAALCCNLPTWTDPHLSPTSITCCLVWLICMALMIRTCLHIRHIQQQFHLTPTP
ncbi:hypothetical protein ACAW74_12240 [Fibrella sp. WM1]|uniref:hypothetical protein n=1 Tax=Fibrella musci TaxID=3242485 RepID=UPI0035205524